MLFEHHGCRTSPVKQFQKGSGADNVWPFRIFHVDRIPVEDQDVFITQCGIAIAGVRWCPPALHLAPPEQNALSTPRCIPDRYPQYGPESCSTPLISIP